MDTNTLAFRSPHGWLEVFCIIVPPKSVPVPGRQHLRYAVGGHGFSGAGDGFVQEAELRTFCTDLVSLLDGGGGSAQLRASPTGGLSLDIATGPEAESLSVVGSIAVSHYRTLKEADGLYLWRTDFGFALRRDSVPNPRRVKWIATYAI